MLPTENPPTTAPPAPAPSAGRATPRTRPASLLLSKHHGLGNDFLVMLEERNGRPLEADPDLARRLCNRRRGIGADGLIVGSRPTPEQAANHVDVVMHLLNSDGSRAEMSGNGIRCLGQALARHRGIDRGGIEVLTDAGRRSLAVAPATATAGTSVPDAGRAVEVSVGMGRPRPGPKVPVALDEFFVSRHGTLDMGNPHLVILVPDPELIELETEGAWLEQQFPAGINVEYVTVDDTGADLAMRVWERGSGVTEACGTGACAAAHLASAWGLVGDDVTVSMPGGRARVRNEPDGTVTLIGPAVHIADVEIDPSNRPGGTSPQEA